MIKNYITIALRNLWRNKIFSLINISGLAIGISSALVIYLIVQFEFSFDQFRKDKNRIYRVVSDMTFAGGMVFKNSGVPMPMPVAVRNDITGIETATHFVTAYEAKVSVPHIGSQSPSEFKKQNSIVYADEFYFSIFEYHWLAGSQQTALKDPFQVVLTESRAKNYFGNLSPANIIGKQIIYNDSVKTIVAGIVKDPEEKATDFLFKEFISLATVMNTGLKEHFGSDSWESINSNSQLFLVLAKGTTSNQVNEQLLGLRKKYIKKSDRKDDTENHLQALSEMHFNAEYDVFDQRQANKPTLYGLLAVAAFLLLL